MHLSKKTVVSGSRKSQCVLCIDEVRIRAIVLSQKIVNSEDICYVSANARIELESRTQRNDCRNNSCSETETWQQINLNPVN